MVTYLQWKSSRKLSQIIWVHGPENVLREELIEEVKRQLNSSVLDYESYVAPDDEIIFWESCRQRSIGEDGNRLLLMRQADKLKLWHNLEEWITSWRRTVPNTYLLFVAENEPQLSSVKAPKATVVKCSTLNKDDMVSWIRERSGLSEAASKTLIEFTNGNLEDASNLCKIIRAVSGEVSNLKLTSQFLSALTNETVSEFTDALMSLDKARAFASISVMSVEDKYRVIGLLDLRLTQVVKLKQLLAAKISNKELATIPGVPFSVVKDLLPSLKMYNDSRILACRRSLSLIDSYQQSGIEDGTLESLVASW